MLHSRKSKKGVEQLRQYREEKLKEYAIMVQYKQLKEVSNPQFQDRFELMRLSFLS